MKKSILLTFAFSVFVSYYFPVNAQDVINIKKFPDSPILFTPRNHDPNLLKSATLSEKSFYQRKSEWQHIIDSTWGPGDPLDRKLEIFNTYAKAIHDQSDVLCRLNLNWDSLYSHYLGQINESTSRGAFSAIMSHFSYDLKDLHTIAFDGDAAAATALNPGVPALIFGIGPNITVEHFGAVTTVLSDSTTLVLRVVPNHPLNIEPGDIILGYEGVPWKHLIKELLNAGLPFMAGTGGCQSADTYANLSGAGLNWHLFNTIDIVKYSTGDTVHLSVLPLINLDIPLMFNNEQLPIQNIPFPLVNMEPYKLSLDKVVTYGTLENTNIGYIFLALEYGEAADAQFYEAINALKYTDGLIIDMRLNYGGYALFEKAFNLLFNESQKTLEHAIRCNSNTFELCPVGNSGEHQINAGPPDYYDKPIAVLLGPQCISMGDITAQRLRYHPMVRFFGKSSGAAHGVNRPLPMKGWFLRYSDGDIFHVSEPGKYLNRTEFPIDYPVWFNKDDVAKGIDPVVEKSLDWIKNLAYGHSISIEKGRYIPGSDTVKINAIIEKPNSQTVSAMLIFEKPDGSVVDSTEMSVCFLKSGNQCHTQWIAKKLPDDIYWVSLKVNNHNDGTSFTNKHITRITNIPFFISELTFKKVAENRYSVQTKLKNGSTLMNISNLDVKLSSKDTWITSISPDQVNIDGVSAGKIKRIPLSSVYVDETAFPNYLNLTYTISKDGWPFWVFDTTLYLFPTGIDEIGIPISFNLEQNYPNPFNSNTTIPWQLAENSKVTLKVLDIVGRTLATLVDEQIPSGNYETRFDAATLPKGIYFYQLKAGENVQTRKMILLE